MSWKIARDPFMSALASRWGDAAVWEAGFFEDADPDDAPLDDLDLLCTPTGAVRRGLAAKTVARPPVVLVSTGGFWPPHRGHIAMMERARETIERGGGAVVAGYLSPGHDHYLRTKRWGAIAPPAPWRVAELWAFLEGCDWLMVDPWESMFRRTSVNFTDVVTRLERYLRSHVDSEIEVVFVCGGDNARFSLAFAERGGCVVVGRPGAEATVERWRTDPRVAPASGVRWVPLAVDEASSRSQPEPAGPGLTTLKLRMESPAAVTRLGLAEDRWESFRVGLASLLSRTATVVPSATRSR